MSGKFTQDGFHDLKCYKFGRTRLLLQNNIRSAWLCTRMLSCLPCQRLTSTFPPLWAWKGLTLFDPEPAKYWTILFLLWKRDYFSVRCHHLTANFVRSIKCQAAYFSSLFTRHSFALPNRHVGRLFIHICLLFVLDPACFSNDRHFEGKLPPEKLILCNRTTRLDAKSPIIHQLLSVTGRLSSEGFHVPTPPLLHIRSPCQVIKLNPYYFPCCITKEACQQAIEYMTLWHRFHSLVEYQS